MGGGEVRIEGGGISVLTSILVFLSSPPPPPPFVFPLANFSCAE